MDEYLPEMDRIRGIYDVRKKLSHLIRLMEKLNFRLNKFKIHACDEWGKKYLEFHITEADLFNKINSIYKKLLQYETQGGFENLEGEVRLLRIKLYTLPNLCHELTELSLKLRTIFTKQYLERCRRPSYIKYQLMFPDQTAVEHQERLKHMQQEYNFATQFQEAYYNGDQAAIFTSVVNYPFEFNYKSIGLSTGLTAYAGVMPLEHDSSGSWDANIYNYEKMPAKYYARRLQKIMLTGYRASERRLPSKFYGLTYYLMNIFFYIYPHQDYGGEHAIISWPCNDYCVFSLGNEYLIITNGVIPPHKLHLQIRNPSGRGVDIKYQQELIAELIRLNIPFKLI